MVLTTAGPSGKTTATASALASTTYSSPDARMCTCAARRAHGASCGRNLGGGHSAGNRVQDRAVPRQRNDGIAEHHAKQRFRDPEIMLKEKHGQPCMCGACLQPQQRI